jgi:ATP-dependent DNA helicase RecQ
VTTTTHLSLDLNQTLRDQWGFDTFRPGQEEVIRALLDGHDVLTVMPTGAGKSLVYQMAAYLLPGITVVVSPLLSLMKDQVAALEARGLAVTVINSAQTVREHADELAEIERGDSKLLYLTPERLANKPFMAYLRRFDVSLFVVDEAHAVSEWGHSFRPAYLHLKDAAHALGKPTMLALTATATPWIRDDIVERLGMRHPRVVVHGVDRRNLFWEVRRVEHEYDDKRVLEQLLTGGGAAYPSPLADDIDAAMEGSGIIYVATTKAARETAQWLQGWGIAADYYHGQRRKVDRVRVQEAWMRGELRVIAATNAFGLGIDKPDVRFVIHRDVPGSLEAYYQEAGRAGRDGAFARCAIIYRPADLGRAAFLGGTGELTREEVVRASEKLREHPETTLEELPTVTGLSTQDAKQFVKTLRQGKIIGVRRGRVRLLKPDFDPYAVPLDDEQRRKAYEQSRLEMMRDYAESVDCRRRVILAYFGDTHMEERCGRCDNDIERTDGTVAVAAHTEHVATAFAAGDYVVHRQWGTGVVERVDADTLTVLFESVGHRALALEVVQDNGLLREA